MSCLRAIAIRSTSCWLYFWAAVVSLSVSIFSALSPSTMSGCRVFSCSRILRRSSSLVLAELSLAIRVLTSRPSSATFWACLPSASVESSVPLRNASHSPTPIERAVSSNPIGFVEIASESDFMAVRAAVIGAMSTIKPLLSSGRSFSALPKAISTGPRAAANPAMVTIVVLVAGERFCNHSTTPISFSVILLRSGWMMLPNISIKSLTRFLNWVCIPVPTLAAASACPPYCLSSSVRITPCASASLPVSARELISTFWSSEN